MGQRDVALKAVDEAIAIGRAGDDSRRTRWLLALLLHQRAHLLQAALPDSLAEMRALNTEALTLVEPWSTSSGRQRLRFVGQVHLLQGNILMHTGDFAGAADLFRSAMRHTTSGYRRPTAQQLGTMATACLNAATCYRRLGDPRTADEYTALGDQCTQAAKDLRRTLSELRATVSDLFGGSPRLP